MFNPSNQTKTMNPNPITFDTPACESEEQRAAKFQETYALNLNDKTEKKNGLTYLSWASAWAEFKKLYPAATFSIIKNPATGLPYFNDDQLGIMVFTEVTADDMTYEMWMPVMDNTNKAMKSQSYTYQTWDGYNKRYVERTVLAATSFDINKAIMRCLVKNLAMFGLGLYIYAGEDLPEQASTEQPTDRQPQTVPQPKKPRKAAVPTAPVQDPYAVIKAAINSADTIDGLLNLYKQHQTEVSGNPDIKALFSVRKDELLGPLVA